MTHYINYKTQLKNKISKKNYNQFYLGDFSTLLDIITIYSLTKEPLYKHLIDNKKNDLPENFNLGSNYLLQMNFDSLSNYNSFLLFGFNPRYESSLLNICFARLRENNDSTFFQFNIGMENFFPVNHQGSHNKNITFLIEGRSSFISNLRLNKSVKSLYGANYSKQIKNTNDLFHFIGNKFSDNNPTFITHDLTTLNYIELFGGNSYLNHYNKYSNNFLLEKKGWFINTSKITRLDKHSDVLEFGLRNINSGLKAEGSNTFQAFIPTKFFYEDSDLTLTLFGKAHKTDKVASNENSSVFAVRNWFSFLNFFSLEKNLNSSRWWLYKTVKNTADHYQLRLNFFKPNFFSILNKNKLSNYFTNLNIYYNNTEHFLHSFKINKSTVYNKSRFNYNFIKLNILNFYLDNKLLSYSSTMTNLSYLYTNNLFLK